MAIPNFKILDFSCIFFIINIMKKTDADFITVLEEFAGLIVHKLNNVLTPLLMLKSIHKDDAKLLSHISNVYDKLEDMKTSLNEFAVKRSATEKLFSANDIIEKVLNISLPDNSKIMGDAKRFEWAIETLKNYAKSKKISVAKIEGKIVIQIPLKQSIEITQMDFNQETIYYNNIDLILSKKIITRYGWKFQLENPELLKISYSIS